MEFEFNNKEPIYLQLAAILEAEILSGSLAPGQKLPSVREISSMARANPNTVQKALAELERKGLIHTERTNGKFVTEKTETISEMKDEQSLQNIHAFILEMKTLGISREELERLLHKEIAEIYDDH